MIDDKYGFDGTTCIKDENLNTFVGETIQHKVTGLTVDGSVTSVKRNKFFIEIKTTHKGVYWGG